MASDRPGTSKSVRLAFPIEHDGKTISEIALRRPRVGDMMEVQRKGGGPAEMELVMVSLLANLPAEVVAQIDMQDYGAIQATLRGFTGT